MLTLPSNVLFSHQEALLCVFEDNETLRNIQKCMKHVFVLEQLKNYQGVKSLTEKPWRGPTTCIERYRELANKKVEQFFKVSSPCLDDHQFKQEELDSVGELAQVCSQIVLKCL